MKHVTTIATLTLALSLAACQPPSAAPAPRCGSGAVATLCKCWTSADCFYVGCTGLSCVGADGHERLGTCLSGQFETLPSPTPSPRLELQASAP